VKILPTRKTAQPDPDFRVAKVNDEQQLVFGWANVTTKGSDLLVDSHGEVIETAVLEKAVYEFVPKFTGAAAGVGHQGIAVAHLVESLMLTKEKAAAMGLDPGHEGWWVGVRVEDAEVFAKVKSGELSMFSIQGIADVE